MNAAAFINLIRTHRARLMLSARILIAALATFGLAHFLGLKQSYWAVLTAIIVMQASVGGAMKAIVDRMVGSLGGAIWGVIVCVAFPDRHLPGLLLALVLALAPLALATAFQPAWRIAPVTALILLLAPTGQAIGPLATAASRLEEVGVGSLVAMIVALTLARSQASANLAGAAERGLQGMAELLAVTLSGLSVGLLVTPLEPIHARIRAAIADGEAAAAEIQREQRIIAGSPFDPAPLLRTLRRLQHDLVMIARAATAPLPEPARHRLEGPMRDLSAAAPAFMIETGRALLVRAAPPDDHDAKAALGLIFQGVTDLRSMGVTRAFPDDAVARLFGFSFALEQLGANLDDLAQRAREFAAMR